MVFVCRSTLAILKLGLFDRVVCDVFVVYIHSLLLCFPLSCSSSPFRPMDSLWGRDGGVIASRHLGCIPDLLGELGSTASDGQ